MINLGSFDKHFSRLGVLCFSRVVTPSSSPGHKEGESGGYRMIFTNGQESLV